jgi:hypothetical protein
MVMTRPFQYLAGDVPKYHPNPPRIGILDQERHPRLGVFATLQPRRIDRCRALSRQFPMTLQGHGPLLHTTGANQRLAQRVMSRRVLRLELHQLLEGSNRRIELLQFLVGAPQVKRDRTHPRIQVPRSLKGLHGLFELAQAQMRAALDVKTRRRMVVQRHHLPGVSHRIRRIACEQVRVRKVELRVRMRWVQLHCPGKRLNRPLRLAAVIVGLAGVHQPDELVALRWATTDR